MTCVVESLAVINHGGTEYEYGIVSHINGMGQLKGIIRHIHSELGPMGWETDIGVTGNRDALVTRMAYRIRGEDYRAAHPDVAAALVEIERLEAEGEAERRRERAKDQAAYEAKQKYIAEVKDSGHTIRFRHKTVDIAQGNGNKLSVRAMVAGGLAVHKSLVWDPKRSVTHTWVVTHEPSGEAVIRDIVSRSRARGIAALLLKAGDWTRDSEDCKADIALRAAVGRYKEIL